MTPFIGFPVSDTRRGFTATVKSDGNRSFALMPPLDDGDGRRLARKPRLFSQSLLFIRSARSFSRACRRESFHTDRPSRRDIARKSSCGHGHRRSVRRSRENRTRSAELNCSADCE